MNPSVQLRTAWLETGGLSLQAAPLMGVDVMRLQVVPEPAAVTLAGVAAAVMLPRRLRCRRASTIGASEAAAA